MFKRELLVVIPVVVLLAVSAAMASDIDWISKDALKEILDDPGTNVVDVRQGRDWKTSDAKIKGAVRANPMYVEEWIYKYPQKDALLVFY
jgi:hypothetical protein